MKIHVTVLLEYFNKAMIALFNNTLPGILLLQNYRMPLWDQLYQLQHSYIIIIIIKNLYN